MKLGKKTADATGKVIRKRAKTLKKVAKNNAAAVSSKVKAKPKRKLRGEVAVSRCVIHGHSLREYLFFIALTTCLLKSTLSFMSLNDMNHVINDMSDVLDDVNWNVNNMINVLNNIIYIVQRH